MNNIEYSEEELKNEMWKDIIGYEGLYQISNLGRIKSLERKVRHNYGGLRIVPEKILKPSPDGDGYLYISLSKEGKKKNPKIHKLVAYHFLENPDNLPQVNHLDEDKNNNRLSNLEWCTCLHNLTHSNIIRKGNIARAKAIVQKSLTGEVIREYESIAEAQRELSLKNHTGIIRCCQGKQNTSHGYKWEYK